MERIIVCCNFTICMMIQVILYESICLVFQTKPVSHTHLNWVDIRMEYRGIDCFDGSGLAILDNEIHNEKVEGMFRDWH